MIRSNLGRHLIVVPFHPSRSLARSTYYRRYLITTSKRLEASSPKPSPPPNDTITATGAPSGQPSFWARLRSRWRETPVVWTPLPVGIGIALLIFIDFFKRRRREEAEAQDRANEAGVKLQGGWQVHVIGALPLRQLSRLYGALNSYTLPVWFRVPGFRFYAFLFGVNLDECEPSDLREYRSLSEFFNRSLKPGMRIPEEALLISPADGRVVNFGSIENRRIGQVKGKDYSMDALLGGTGPIMTNPATGVLAGAVVDEEEFANLNGIEYSLDQLIGDEEHHRGDPHMPYSGANTPPPPHEHKDASIPEGEDGMASTIVDHASVALSVAPSNLPWTVKGVPKPGNKMFFSVIYLAPGDYHRFHSPTAWVVERRRHFAGELFSVSPWMTKRLQDLFVLNERVALLGRWRHGFFSMTAVGATNVGSIHVKFDRDLRTNFGPRPNDVGTFSEATYHKASKLLNGQPLRPGDEVGGFWLGRTYSTIVLVFEAPETFQFAIKLGDKVRVGQRLGDVPPKDGVNETKKQR